MEAKQQLETLLKPYYYQGQTEMDITSVLKYLNENNPYKTMLHYNLSISIIGDIFELYFYGEEEDRNGDMGESEIIYNIPNKSLELYSETEIQDLLELLLKLK